MNQFMSQVRRRLGRPHEHGVLGRLRDEAGYVAEVANGRIRLRDCDEVGAWVRVVGRPRVENQGRIEIGERTRLICGFAPVELRAGRDAELRIGGQGSINFGTAIVASRRVTIGDRAAIGPYCVIADTELHDLSPKAASDARPIEIGDDVWLASRVTVLPGAKIGRGSVITAGSVVAGEIPPQVVAGGSPARVLRRLGSAGATAAAVAAPQANGKANGSTEKGVALEGAMSTAARKTERAAYQPPPPAPRPAVTHRGVLISDFTIDDLGRCIEADSSVPGMAATVAPFDQVVPTLMAGKSGEHDYAVVWTRPEGVLPAFARAVDFEIVDDAALLADVDAFAALLIRGLEGYRFAFVPTWTVPPWKRGLGVVDARASGISRALTMANQRLIEKLDGAPNVFVLSAQRWFDEVGRGAHSAKLWYMGKVPFHPSVFEQATLDIKAAVQGITGLSRKLVVVDLDDTLWGGIVGDVGWEKLRLGGHDSVGEAFVDFQRALKSLKRRGILLAVVSKNDENVALEAMRSHSAMVLKESDLVGWRINWNDKARNVADLAASLNLGLQSTVFIDDNPFERARVREALPEVFVPEWPEDKLAYASALLSLRCFDTPIRSSEDAARTEMYASERQRDELRAQVGSLDDWLRSLQLKVRVDPLGSANLARTTQLLNKTNQLNLSTRRLTEAELSAWAAEPGHSLYAISVSDRLGDAGLTGILGMQEEPGGVARVVDYVLSCRVMGRRVEETMIYLAIDTARKKHLDRIVADLIPTPKNKPCLEFFQRSGFRREGETRFTWDTRDPYLVPDVISLSVSS